jgi:hypothetical protein
LPTAVLQPHTPPCQEQQPDRAASASLHAACADGTGHCVRTPAAMAMDIPSPIISRFIIISFFACITGLQFRVTGVSPYGWFR